ncbi:MAG TPA: mechanosensitive ion channel domain-containing protein [Rhodopila sp.]|nr:mechanosensitive ion channel domain-containing protein [Rhodopila sp.]
MMRVLFTLLCLILSGLVTSAAYAQKAAPPAPSAISAEQAQTVLEVLNDPARRAAFAATLNAIIKAQPARGTAPATAAHGSPPAQAAPAAPAATTVEGVSIPLAPDSLGAEVLLSASEFVNRVGDKSMKALDTVQSLPLLYGWAVVMATNPIARNLLVDVSWRVAIIVACAIAVQWGLRRLMRRPIMAVETSGTANQNGEAEPSLEAEPPPQDGVARAEDGETEAPSPVRPRPSAWALLRRVPLVLARLALELVPVLGIALVGHMLAASNLGGQTVSRLIILAVIDSYAACAALLCIARMLLSPTASRLRLFHLEDKTADYLMRWTRRLVLIVVVGYAAGEVGLLLGLSSIAHDALQKTIGLIVHVCLIVIVLRNRRAVRRWLRAPEGASDFTARVRNTFARIWHWIALFFLVAGWLIWAVEVPHGYAAMLHYFVLTALVLIAARLVLLLLLGVIDRTMKPAPDAAGMPPGIQERLRAYHPLVSTAFRLLIWVLCALGLLQLYGLNTFMWLITSALGLRLLSAIGTLTATIVFAFTVWEVVNGGFQQHLNRLQREAQMARSARLRTLLPLLRTTLMITITVVAGLMVLSEIGINVAPLLAGAGIVGVAIGFGSQKLVQDLITGIFLLLENAMQVGDWVTVSGLSGTVENLSVRTIRLRAGDGSVHIIPFSAVTSVTNVNRGLGNAAISVTVAFEEDTDRVARELATIVTQMRADPELSAKMLSDLQLWGVDKVDGASATIVGQIVCTDSGRWAVQREFNRRMKQRFQSLGIRVFNPTQTVALPAPPPRPALEREAAPKALQQPAA